MYVACAEGGYKKGNAHDASSELICRRAGLPTSDETAAASTTLSCHVFARAVSPCYRTPRRWSPTCFH